MKGEWHEKVFTNDRPITLELGCGKGEYTVNLARKFPERNFIGVDVKGHRFHKGAKLSYEEGLKNVAFLRTRVEFLDSFFAPGEVHEIWLTFSDPQPKDEKGNRRITSLWYIINKYLKFLKPGGKIHIKHDNPLVYDLAMEEIEATPLIIETSSQDLYGEFFNSLDDDWKEIMGWKTYYEEMWLDEGKKIHYLRLRIPREPKKNIERKNNPQKEFTFFENVYDVVRLIPKGRVTSYGAIAKYIGTGLSSRMVGWAMNAAHGKNVPAHRVVNRIGLLTGKNHFETPYRMQELLEAEGIEVKNDRVVKFNELLWDPLKELVLE